MAQKLITVGDLIRTGRMQKGDYIEYIPTIGEYMTKSSETGVLSATIKTETDIKWTFDRFDEKKNTFFIQSVDGANLLELRGSVGFVNGPKVMNSVCVICYSDPAHGIFARNKTIEDYGYESQKHVERYAYYPANSNEIGVIEYKKCMYQKTNHKYGNGGRFYVCDVGGVQEKDEHGVYFCKPTKNRPVFVSKSYEQYRNEELLSKKCWVASQCVYPDLSRVSFSLYTASFNIIDNTYLCSSNGYEDNAIFSVRPYVPLSTFLYVDISDESRDGKTPQNAWKLLQGILFKADIESMNENCANAHEENAVNDETDEKDDNNTMVTQESVEKYKIVCVRNKSLEEALKKLEEEVNRLIADGFEVNGTFKLNLQNDEIILMQQMGMK